MSSEGWARNNTCCCCGMVEGVWECDVCGEAPLCQGCVDEYTRNDWEGHGCFCSPPSHNMHRIDDTPYYEDISE